MFYATAGKGTEAFLAAEVQNETKAPGQSLDQTVSIREGKVFFSQTKSNLKECIQSIMSLRSAERVFVAIADYDNSEYVTGKRAFLDKVMTVLIQKDIYKQANMVLKTMRDCSCQERNAYQRSPQKAAGDEVKVTEPEGKRPKLEIDDCQAQRLSAVEHGDGVESPTKNEPDDKPFTFRMSIKCSGKLRKKMDLKRLSRDFGWRVEQASGWKVQLRQPDLEVCVHISDEHVTVGIPITRHPLSRRNYIQDSGLRAPVAWIMCTLADIKPGDLVLDPMCGKATILLEGASNWQDAFYLGSDNAMDKIKIAAQNVCSSNSERIDVALVDGLKLPYRNCCTDVVVCDAPFNQNHQTSLMPQVFYRKFLEEVHRVLRHNGRCILLTSQELVSTILNILQTSRNIETKQINLGHTHSKDNQGKESKAFSEYASPCAYVEKQEWIEEKHFNYSHSLCPKATELVESCREISKSDKMSTSTSRDKFIEESLFSQKKESFELVSQHAVKLGETLACILKLIKK